MMYPLLLPSWWLPVFGISHFAKRSQVQEPARLHAGKYIVVGRVGAGSFYIAEQNICTWPCAHKEGMPLLRPSSLRHRRYGSLGLEHHGSTEIWGKACS